MSVFEEMMQAAEARPAHFVVSLQSGQDFVFKHDSDLEEVWDISNQANQAVKAAKKNIGISPDPRIASRIIHLRRRHVGFRAWVPIEIQPNGDSEAERETLIAQLDRGEIRLVNDLFCVPGETIAEQWTDNQFKELAKALPHAFDELFKQVDGAISVGSSKADYEYIAAKKKS